MHVRICSSCNVVYLEDFELIWYSKMKWEKRKTFVIVLTQFYSTTLSKVFFIMSKTCSKQQNKQLRLVLQSASILKKYLKRHHTFRECYICANFCRHVNISYVFTLILINMRTIPRNVELHTNLRVSTQRKEKRDTTAVIRAQRKKALVKLCVHCTQGVKWFSNKTTYEMGRGDHVLLKENRYYCWCAPDRSLNH